LSNFLVDMEISVEEMGVIITALATLHGMQAIKQPSQMTPMEREYTAAIDSIIRKFCKAAGLPENFCHETKASALRELMFRKNKQVEG
jgi:hypothetical protein